MGNSWRALAPNVRHEDFHLHGGRVGPRTTVVLVYCTLGIRRMHGRLDW